jgi:hypothetical protein
MSSNSANRIQPLASQTGAALVPLAGHFYQLSYVVWDMEAAVEDLGKSFGVSFTLTAGQGDPALVSYKGKPSDVSVAMAFADLRGIELEIIRPVNRNNLYTDFLEQRGPGLHHVGFKIPGRQQYRNYCQLLLDNGNTALMEGSFTGETSVDFCYFDASAFGASVIELSYFY